MTSDFFSTLFIFAAAAFVSFEAIGNILPTLDTPPTLHTSALAQSHVLDETAATQNH